MLIFGGAYIQWGLSTEGNLRFKVDWASHIVGSKFTVFALFYVVFEGNFQKYKPPGGLYLEGRFDGGFLRYLFGGLIFGILRYFAFILHIGTEGREVNELQKAFW